MRITNSENGCTFSELLFDSAPFHRPSDLSPTCINDHMDAVSDALRNVLQQCIISTSPEALCETSSFQEFQRIRRLGFEQIGPDISISSNRAVARALLRISRNLDDPAASIKVFNEDTIIRVNEIATSNRRTIYLFQSNGDLECFTTDANTRLPNNSLQGTFKYTCVAYSGNNVRCEVIGFLIPFWVTPMQYTTRFITVGEHRHCHDNFIVPSVLVSPRTI